MRKLADELAELHCMGLSRLCWLLGSGLDGLQGGGKRAVNVGVGGDHLLLLYNLGAVFSHVR